MPLKPALGVRGTVAGHRLGALEGGRGRWLGALEGGRGRWLGALEGGRGRWLGALEGGRGRWLGALEGGRGVTSPQCIPAPKASGVGRGSEAGGLFAEHLQKRLLAVSAALGDHGGSPPPLPMHPFFGGWGGSPGRAHPTPSRAVPQGDDLWVKLDRPHLWRTHLRYARDNTRIERQRLRALQTLLPEAHRTAAVLNKFMKKGV